MGNVAFQSSSRCAGTSGFRPPHGGSAKPTPSTSGSRAGCRIRRKDLIARYACDPRRLYEIWEEKRFTGSRAKALELFRERHPTLLDRVDCGPHRRIPRGVPAELQPGLFDHLDGQPT